MTETLEARSAKSAETRGLRLIRGFGSSPRWCKRCVAEVLDSRPEAPIVLPAAVRGEIASLAVPARLDMSSVERAS